MAISLLQITGLKVGKPLEYYESLFKIEQIEAYMWSTEFGEYELRITVPEDTDLQGGLAALLGVDRIIFSDKDYLILWN